MVSWCNKSWLVVDLPVGRVMRKWWHRLLPSQMCRAGYSWMRRRLRYYFECSEYFVATPHYWIYYLCYPPVNEKKMNIISVSSSRIFFKKEQFQRATHQNGSQNLSWFFFKKQTFLSDITKLSIYTSLVDLSLKSFHYTQVLFIHMTVSTYTSIFPILFIFQNLCLYWCVCKPYSTLLQLLERLFH